VRENQKVARRRSTKYQKYRTFNNNK